MGIIARSEIGMYEVYWWCVCVCACVRACVRACVCVVCVCGMCVCMCVCKSKVSWMIMMTSHGTSIIFQRFIKCIHVLESMYNTSLIQKHCICYMFFLNAWFYHEKRILIRIPSRYLHINVQTQWFAILTHESTADNDNFAQDQDLDLISFRQPFYFHFSGDAFAWNSNRPSTDWIFPEHCTFPHRTFTKLGNTYHECFDCFPIVTCKK